jgi:hypothetical protein
LAFDGAPEQIFKFRTGFDWLLNQAFFRLAQAGELASADT